MHNNAQCTGYSDQQAGIAAGVMIFTGLVIGSLTTARLFASGSKKLFQIGSFIVGPLARRWQKQEEVFSTVGALVVVTV